MVVPRLLANNSSIATHWYGGTSQVRYRTGTDVRYCTVRSYGIGGVEPTGLSLDGWVLQ